MITINQNDDQVIKCDDLDYLVSILFILIVYQFTIQFNFQKINICI